MVSKNLRILVPWMKLASALEGLSISYMLSQLRYLFIIVYYYPPDNKHFGIFLNSEYIDILPSYVLNTYTMILKFLFFLIYQFGSLHMVTFSAILQPSNN